MPEDFPCCHAPGGCTGRVSRDGAQCDAATLHSTEDFPCDNEPHGCDGRVTVQGTLCVGPCNCRALERVAERLIEALPDVRFVWVGRAARGQGPLVITVNPDGISRMVCHELHLAISQALHGSHITHNHPFSLVFV